ncbi:chitin deacetylase 7-like [Octopus sinensis]|uniref:Chitin deacetylase 7-like n=1 Tax=Octopus sinensis TaxID=2607531 RepID=A0A6P7TUF0_9MOLL|nr:chitin deacetylase 7-like [Octopus sinensis]
MYLDNKYYHFVTIILAILSYLGDGQQICDSTTCKAPNCHCSGVNIPGGFHPEDIPQIVLLSFDDAVNWDNWDYYLKLFPPDGRRKNPNGCPISMTLFVSHNYTDYCMVRKLHGRGIEIADHSLTHQVPHEWWKNASEEELANEILTQRHNLANLAEIPIEHIRGWRSPFLQPTGDTMFTILWKNNFTYDATLTHPFPRNVYSPVIWPFTLDSPLAIGCNIKPCPQKSYPGFWEVPVVTLMDYREHLPCAYVDFCQNKPRNKDEAFQILWKNFLRNYRTNRAPYYLNLHSPWLDKTDNLDAMDEFLNRLVAMEDVFIINIHQALEWMRSPTSNMNIMDFLPWQCPFFKPNIEDGIYCVMTYKPRTTTTKAMYSNRPNKDSNSDARKNNQTKLNSNINRAYPPGFFEEEQITRHTTKRRPWFLRNSAARNNSFKFVIGWVSLFWILFSR